jgi:hypothetical protein
MSQPKRYSSKKDLRASLPDDVKKILKGDFWNTSALDRIPPSTFGSSPKTKRIVKLDDGYEVTRTSMDWVAIDEHNFSHGRVKIEATLGKLIDNPAPGHYSPKIDSQSKRETIAPLLSISQKPVDNYFEDLKDIIQTRTAVLQMEGRNQDKEKKKKKKAVQYRIKPGDLADVNIEDMRKG